MCQKPVASQVQPSGLHQEQVESFDARDDQVQSGKQILQKQ